ncbi:unnamed protein product [Peniophora sp. CBMAI 1063]|nr:unnamed protein product [Peniophora sp. CBMAI 1063]
MVAPDHNIPSLFLNIMPGLLHIPEELLRLIAFKSLEVDRVTGKPDARFSWLGLTQVCQRTRNVLLADAVFWAHSVCLTPNVEMLPTLLARTHGVPLDVDLDLIKLHPLLEGHSQTSKRLQIFQRLSSPEVVNRAHRIRCLRWIGMVGDMDPNFWRVRLSGKEFRHLRMLSIHVPSNSEPLQPFVAPSLQLLSIHGPWSEDQHVISVDVLLSIWDKAPQLQTLELKYALTQSATQPQGAHVARGLRVLRFSSLHESAWLALAPHITVPSSAELRVNIDFPMTLDSTFYAFRTVALIEPGAVYEVHLESLPRGAATSPAFKYSVYIAAWGRGTSLQVSRRRDPTPLWTWEYLCSLLSGSTRRLILGVSPHERPFFGPTRRQGPPLFDLTGFLGGMRGIEMLTINAKDIMAGALDLLPRGHLPRELVVQGGPGRACLDVIKAWLTRRESEDGAPSPRPTLILCHGVIEKPHRRDTLALSSVCSEIRDERVLRLVEIVD